MYQVTYTHLGQWFTETLTELEARAELKKYGWPNSDKLTPHEVGEAIREIYSYNR
jgi:hypothetical protein